MECGMQDIVRNSQHLSEYDKDVLCAVFEKLEEKQNELLKNIAENVEKQMFRTNETDVGWEIITALIDRSEIDEAGKNGLNEVIKIVPFRPRLKFEDLGLFQNNNTPAKGTYSAGVAFLKCAYHEVVDIIGRKYAARVTSDTGEYDVEYYFTPYSVYYKYEELLEKTARQYGVARPALFSPQSRRAVCVNINFGERKISKSDHLLIDFKIEENHLANILQIEKTLVWNVEIVDSHEMPRPKENIEKRVVPLFDQVFQIYEFSVEEKEYIYADTKISDVKRFGNCIYMNLTEGRHIEDTRYWKVRINDCTRGYEEKLSDKYWNFYKLERVYKERVRTEADIQYVLGFFENDMISYLGIARTIGENRAIRTYEDRDRYHYSKNRKFRSSAFCYVKFEESEDWLFEDYISYVISYMNYYYPEFYWVGVV